jgi:hypothetical protein
VKCSKVDVLFGKLEEILKLNSEVFMRELEKCIKKKEMVDI